VGGQEGREVARRAYWQYLQLAKLLDCQQPPDFERPRPRSSGRDDRGDGAGGAEEYEPRPLAHHDELLFIVVHQAFELWFKQLVHELRHARDLLGRPDRAPAERQVPETDIPEICATLARMVEILRVLTEQWRIVETMPPGNFLAFRDRLIPASGFQSLQFRLLEVISGLPAEARVSIDGRPFSSRFSPELQAELAAASREMTLREALLEWLARTPIEAAFPEFPRAFAAAFDGYAEAQKRLQLGNPYLPAEARGAIERRFEDEKAACRTFLATGDARMDCAHAAYLFLTSYREEPLLRWPSQLLERIIEYEETLRIFRFRHARMVERMIGLRVGTGGSSGVDYLDETARRHRIFGELLAAQSFLLARDRLPPVPRPELLGFRFG
jgi:tryptophan 2,3-dioxygenase